MLMAPAPAIMLSVSRPEPMVPQRACIFFLLLKINTTANKQVGEERMYFVLYIQIAGHHREKSRQELKAGTK